MKKVKDRSFSIILKTVTLNFFNILYFYPRMVYMTCHKDRYSVDEKYAFSKKLIKKLTFFEYFSHCIDNHILTLCQNAVLSLRRNSYLLFDEFFCINNLLIINKLYEIHSGCEVRYGNLGFFSAECVLHDYSSEGIVDAVGRGLTVFGYYEMQSVGSGIGI